MVAADTIRGQREGIQDPSVHRVNGGFDGFLADFQPLLFGVFYEQSKALDRVVAVLTYIFYDPGDDFQRGKTLTVYSLRTVQNDFWNTGQIKPPALGQNCATLLVTLDDSHDR